MIIEFRFKFMNTNEKKNTIKNFNNFIFKKIMK